MAQKPIQQAPQFILGEGRQISLYALPACAPLQASASARLASLRAKLIAAEMQSNPGCRAVSCALYPFELST